MTYRLRNVILVAIAGILLASCDSTVQVTSGRDYLGRYPDKQTFTPKGEIDRKVREAAEVEPILRFPARIGLARIEDGRISAIPGAEAEAWTKVAQELGSGFGTFVPVSRLVAGLMQRDTVREWNRNYGQDRRNDPAYDPIEIIRLTAARQHLDAVLVYEVYSVGNSDRNVLSPLDVSIVGAFVLPGRDIDAKGFASALLVDVRNGYPYGTANAVVKRSEITPAVGSDDKLQHLADEAKIAAGVKLSGEALTMIRTLKTELTKLETDPPAARPKN